MEGHVFLAEMDKYISAYILRPCDL